MHKLRLGMVGCGWALEWMYGPSLRFLENGELVAGADLSAEGRERAKRWGARQVFEGLDKMLAQADIDAVMVTTPPHLHRDAVVQAAAAGKHVYCEKPMCVTIEEADQMIAACREAGVQLMIAFMKRFNKSFRRAAEIIEQGELGDVFELRATWDNARAAASTANYRHQRAAGGGYLQEDGSHPVDVLRWWGGPVVEVAANVLIVGADRWENDDVSHVMLRHESGAISSLHITMLTHRTGRERYEVFGTRGTMTFDCVYHSSPTLEPHIIRVYRDSHTCTDLSLGNSWSTEEEFRSNYQYLQELRHFCDCVLNGEPVSPTGQDGRAVVEILNAAYASSQEGTKVALPLERSIDIRAHQRQLRDLSPFTLGDHRWASRY